MVPAADSSHATTVIATQAAPAITPVTIDIMPPVKPVRLPATAPTAPVTALGIFTGFGGVIPPEGLVGVCACITVPKVPNTSIAIITINM